MGISLTILLASVSNSVNAQTPHFEWAQQIGSTKSDYAYGITTDTAGNIYATGGFEGTVDFGTGLSMVQLTDASGLGPDIYVDKLNADGRLLWVKQFKGSSTSNSNIGMSVKTDSANNVYITGTFTGKVDFDPGADTFYLTSTGGVNTFLVKLSKDGAFLWAKRMGGYSVYSHCEVIGMTLSPDHNVYITGKFYGEINFNPSSSTPYNLSSTSSSFADVFIEKFSNNGTLLWVKKIGGAKDDIGYSITSDVSNNIYVCGEFNSQTVDFDPGPGVANLTNQGSWDIFILKLDKNGNFRWVKQIGGNNPEEAKGITADKLGHLYTVGDFASTSLDFDPGPGVHNMTTSFVDGFILKLDTAGNFIYAKEMGGTNSDNQAKSVAVDNSGNCYVTGYFSGTSDFGNGTPNSELTAFGALGNSNVATYKYDAQGNFQWVKQMGSDGNCFGFAVCVSMLGEVYSAGTFTDSCNFNPSASNGYILGSHGLGDAFIQKIAQCNSVANVSLGGIADSLLNNNTVQFSPSSLTNGEYYYWDFGDGTYSYEQNPIHNYTNSGLYTVTLIVSNNCGTPDSATMTINIYPEGISNNELSENNLKVFPNPANNVLFIKDNSKTPIKSITVYSLLGSKIYEQQAVNSFRYQLDTRKFASGQYSLKVVLKNGYRIFKKFEKME